MTDKGFNIQDILAIPQVYLLAKSKVSPKATALTRRIARARFHVERMIRKVKLFRILRSPITLTIKPYINAIVTVCGKPSLINY